MTIKELKEQHAINNHVFDDCEILRDLVLWMNNRSESLNQNKSINQLLREFLKDQLGIK
jgi:hypothetical protein